MKRINSYLTICFILIICFFLNSFAQQPGKVYSIVKQIKSFEWYKSAAEGWKKVIGKDKSNTEAWLNFYTANRMARMMYYDQWQNSKGEYFKELDTIVSQMEKDIPATFEYFYVKYYNSNSMKEEDLNNLFQAYKIDSNRVETYDDLVKYYEINRDAASSKKICQKWYERNDVSPGILNWNYNVLASLEKNSIIITNGDNDTYPIWILQNVQNFRKDVTLININLIAIEEYRDKLFKECEINTLKIDWSKLKSQIELFKTILLHTIKNSNTRPVYLALTLNPAYYEDVKDKVYMTGLAFKYSEKDIENMAMMINNYENNWLLDYLKVDFTFDISSSVINQINTNYLPVFAKLYNHYKLIGNNDKMNRVKLLAKTVADKSDANKYFDELFQ